MPVAQICKASFRKEGCFFCFPGHRIVKIPEKTSPFSEQKEHWIVINRVNPIWGLIIILLWVHYNGFFY